MPIRSAINDLVPDVQAWRREIHQNPGLMYDVEGTAQFVADRLRAFGCDEVKTSIGRTGVVGVIRGAKGSSERAIGLRADMDALPIEEETNLPYRSKIPGKMHACGHDGHTAMLLGAAQRLAQTRDFAGAAIVIFQPAEEGGAGAMAMIDDGLMDTFGIEEVYGMHNMPSLPVGSFRLRKGPLMAAADEITITVEGQGGHGAMPHHGVDPVVVGAQIVVALQTIVSRNVDPLDSCVVSVTRFEAGTASNIIPQIGLAQRHGPHAQGRDPRRGRKANPRDRRRRRRGGRGDSAGRVSPRLSDDGQSRQANRLRRLGRPQGRGRSPCRSERRAGHGRGGLFLHARGAAGGVHLHRQRRHRQAASPLIRL